MNSFVVSYTLIISHRSWITQILWWYFEKLLSAPSVANLLHDKCSIINLSPSPPESFRYFVTFILTHMLFAHKHKVKLYPLWLLFIKCRWTIFHFATPRGKRFFLWWFLRIFAFWSVFMISWILIRVEKGQTWCNNNNSVIN